MKKLAIICLLLPALLFANTPERPNVDGWDFVQRNNISIKTSDDEVVYLGFETLYRNPDNEREFVMVIERFVPFVLVEKLPRGSGITGEKIKIIRDFNDKGKAVLFEELLEKSDSFIYFKWQTVLDPRTGEDILVNDIESWMMGHGGDWSFRLGPISRDPFSEPNRFNPDELVSVGIRLGLDGEDHYHILIIDQAYLGVLAGGGGNAK